MQINPTKLVGLFAVSAVLIGAAVIVSWFLFGRGLNHDVRRMIQTMASVKTVTVKTEWFDASRSSVPFFPPPSEDFSVHFGSAGPVDLTDLTNIIFDQTFALTTSVKGAEMRGEYKDLAGARYLYLQAVPTYNDVNLTAFRKQWISIPKSFSFSALSGEGELQDISQEHIATLLMLFSKLDVVDATKTGIVEIIDGDVTLPYEFVINKEGLRVILTTIWEMQHGEQMDTQTFAALTDRISELDNAHGVMWIGRKSFLLHRLTFKTDDQKWEINVKDFNQSVDIKTPVPDTDVVAVLGTLGFNTAALPTAENGSIEKQVDAPTTNTSLPGSTASAAENTTDPDNDGMDNSFEFFYGTDPNNPDTDGDGLTDAYEVEHSTNPRGSGSIFSFGLPQL